MKTILVSVSVATAALTVVSCRTTFDGESGINRSKVTSVTMKVPEKDSKGTAFSVEGFSIQVKKDAGDCSFTDIDSTNKIAAQGGNISESLKQDCDYSIKLSFGKLSDDGKSMKDVYLTNAEHDGKPAQLVLVKKADLKGQSKITVKACVSVTALGVTELKIAAGECLAITDQTADVSIDVSIGGGPVATNKIEAPKFEVLPTTLPDAVKKPLEDTQTALLAGVEGWNKESDATKRHDAACLKLTDASSKFKSAIASETLDSAKTPAPEYTKTFAPIKESYRNALNSLNEQFACGETPIGP